MPISLKTKRGLSIQVADDPVAKPGGEGAVHAVLSPTSHVDYCVKIYAQEKRSERHRKVEFMMNNPPDNIGTGTDSLFKTCWPVDLVFNGSTFCGFMMPLAFAQSKSLYHLCSSNLDGLDRVWKTKYDRSSGRGVISRLKLCVNLSSALHSLHSTGNYVLVDFKPQNVLVTHDGRVSLVDIDSIQISKRGKLLFSTLVATPEYKPKESKALKLGVDVIPVSWDRFSFAVTLYELLFGIHPFSASFSGKFASASSIKAKIDAELFVFGKHRSFLHRRPAPHSNFKRLPPSLRQLFMLALDAGSSAPSVRPSIEDWGKTIFAEITGKSAAIKRRFLLALLRSRSQALFRLLVAGFFALGRGFMSILLFAGTGIRNVYRRFTGFRTTSFLRPGSRWYSHRWASLSWSLREFFSNRSLRVAGSLLLVMSALIYSFFRFDGFGLVDELAGSANPPEVRLEEYANQLNGVVISAWETSEDGLEAAVVFQNGNADRSIAYFRNELHENTLTNGFAFELDLESVVRESV